MRLTKSKELCNDDTYAGSVMSESLRSPSPPQRTGSTTWDQLTSLKETLVRELMADRKRSSMRMSEDGDVR